MEDIEKTKEQLIKEVKLLRSRVAEFEMLEPERKQAEEALQAGENKYRTLLENLPQKIFLKDRNSVYMSCNENYARDLKIKSEEIVGKTDYDFFPKELAEKYIADDKRIMEWGGVEDIEERYIQDGEDVFVHTVKTPIKDERGNSIGILGIFWDITERKKAEEALRESEANYKDLADSITDVFFAMDKDLRYTYWNRASEKLTGISAKEAIGKSLYEIFPGTPETRKAERAYLDVLRTQQPKSFVNEYQLGGKDFFFEISAYPSKGGLSVFVKDVTERKKVEEELKIKDEAVASSINAIAITDLEAKLDYVNNSFLRMWGYDNEKEVLRKSGLEFWESKKIALQTLKIVQDKGNWIGELVGKRKDGSFFDVHLSANIVKDVTGKPICIMVSFIDVTERKKAEEEIRKLATIVNESKVPMATVDMNGIVATWNKSCEDMLGYGAGEMIGKIPMSKICPGAAGQIQITFEEGYCLDKELEYIAKDGRVIPCSTSTFLIKNETGSPIGVGGISIDITERKKTEQELQTAYQKLKETQEELIQSGKMAAMGQLASGISHELNQPLTGIKGFAQTILVDSEEDNPIKEDLERIIEQTDRMDKIIKNVRFFARKSEFNLEELDINQPIKDSLILLKEQLKVHNIHLKESLGEGLPKIKGDSNQLQQVFLNIITNARDAIDSLKNPGCGELIVKSFLSEDKNNIEIIFQDTGDGIPNENLDYIFNPFFTTKSPDGGIGLGLSIAYRIIENHRGRIEVSSNEGKGATFRITLPIS